MKQADEIINLLASVRMGLMPTQRAWSELETKISYAEQQISQDQRADFAIFADAAKTYLQAIEIQRTAMNISGLDLWLAWLRHSAERLERRPSGSMRSA